MSLIKRLDQARLDAARSTVHDHQPRGAASCTCGLIDHATSCPLWRAPWTRRNMPERDTTNS